MDADPAKEIEDVNPDGEPVIRIIKRAQATGRRLGVFASSFNPPTTAHFELIRRAAEAFSLDEVLALAGKTNADKRAYECSLEDRIAMLSIAADIPYLSIGLSSHAFYVDMIEALSGAYLKQTDLHFIVGFDTFERVLDAEDRYTKKYYREYKGRVEALKELFANSSFIVAARTGAGLDSVRSLVAQHPAVPPARVLYLDFPPDLGELSATEVRNRRREGKPITGLVPPAIEEYIHSQGIYSH
jgi:nicotinate (nicotinamide) nucleotide adenylyltransferase